MHLHVDMGFSGNNSPLIYQPAYVDIFRQLGFHCFEIDDFGPLFACMDIVFLSGASFWWKISEGIPV